MKKDIHNEYYAYQLINPLNNLPFYVGKGYGTRMYSHITEAHKPLTQQNNPFKCNVIREIEKAGKQIQYYYEISSSEEAYKKECEWIKQFGRINNNTGILTNITDGGDFGNPRCVKIDKYTIKQQFVCTYDSIVEAARSEGINETALRRLVTGKSNLKSIKQHIYVLHGTECPFYKDSRPKRVIQKKGNKIINTFKNTKEAATAIGHKTPSSIRNCCRGVYNHVKGYTFDYE